MSYGTCKKCGCTDKDCTQCIEKSGKACFWINESHNLCSVCFEQMQEAHTHYLGILEMTYQAKNKLQKEVLEYFISIDRMLIQKEYVENLKAFISNKIEEINSQNPRCTPLEIYFEHDNESLNPKGDIIIRNAHVVHYTIRKCEFKKEF